VTAPRVLMLDHRDSFVFNLVDAYARAGCEVNTVRAQLAPAQLDRLLADWRPDLVVLSPGPGHPAEATTTLHFLRAGRPVPTLGVCLGHQAMGLAAGGEVDRARRPVHGRASRLRAGGDPLFAGLPADLAVGRYHSLVITRVPADLEVIATADDDGGEVPMAIRHRRLPWVGFQFHPESALTAWGDRLLLRVLDEALSPPPRPCSQP
jgi:anthranilate synthase/aminodeoxychorismate synthase-like glutamine amidotransferase